jgi:Polysaccharide deacetylase
MALNSLGKLWARTQGRYQRTASRMLFKRRLPMRNRLPLISFTFDDFPRSALHAGGEILEAFGYRGTYYASFGLMGTRAPTGEIFLPTDIPVLFRHGHELACHTYDHHNAWETDPAAFEASIRKNRKALEEFDARASFRSFSYPITEPHPITKRLAGTHFESCRGGGQMHNAKELDLGLLRSFFIEKSREHPEHIQQAIDQNCRDGGWLIFSTHDVSETPTRFGCTPGLLHQIVQMAADSGAAILPVASALESIRGGLGRAG